jgi:hypothetical protein
LEISIDKGFHLAIINGESGFFINLRNGVVFKTKKRDDINIRARELTRKLLQI